MKWIYQIHFQHNTKYSHFIQTEPFRKVRMPIQCHMNIIRIRLRHLRIHQFFLSISLIHQNLIKTARKARVEICISNRTTSLEHRSSDISDYKWIWTIHKMYVAFVEPAHGHWKSGFRIPSALLTRITRLQFTTLFTATHYLQMCCISLYESGAFLLVKTLLICGQETKILECESAFQHSTESEGKEREWREGEDNATTNGNIIYDLTEWHSRIKCI